MSPGQLTRVNPDRRLSTLPNCSIDGTITAQAIVLGGARTRHHSSREPPGMCATPHDVLIVWVRTVVTATSQPQSAGRDTASCTRLRKIE
jgi:hypothetical protein